MASPWTSTWRLPKAYALLTNIRSNRLGRGAQYTCELQRGAAYLRGPAGCDQAKQFHCVAPDLGRLGRITDQMNAQGKRGGDIPMTSENRKQVGQQVAMLHCPRLCGGRPLPARARQFISDINRARAVFSIKECRRRNTNELAKQCYFGEQRTVRTVIG